MTAAAAAQEPPRWPFPGDSPLVRARKLLHSCRALLHTANPDLGRQFDEMALGYGETWVVPKLITHTDRDLLDPEQAADFLCITMAGVRRLRHVGRLTGVKIDGTWYYRVSDLREVQGPRRRRRVGRENSAQQIHSGQILANPAQE